MTVTENVNIQAENVTVNVPLLINYYSVQKQLFNNFSNWNVSVTGYGHPALEDDSIILPNWLLAKNAFV